MPSLRRTRKKLQKQVIRWTIWLSITFIFVLGMFSGFTWVERQIREADLPRAIAQVNGEKISRQQYEDVLRRVAQLGQRLSAQDWSFYKEHVFHELVDAELLRQEAYRRGIRVTRADINKRIDEILQIQLVSARQQYEQNKEFRDFVRKQYGSLDGLASELRHQIRQQSGNLEQEILMEKLRHSVMDEVNVTEKELQDNYTQFRLRHIFVSADRFLPKDLPKGKSPTEQDRRQAKEKASQRARELRERLLKGEDFANLASKESDDPVTKNKGGELGELSLDAAKWRIGDDASTVLPKLKVGEISEPIEGFNGYHIVKLEGKRVNLPQDYNKVRYQCEEKKCNNIWLGDKGEKKCPKCGSTKIKQIGERKKELIDELKQQRMQERWSKLLRDLRESAKIEVYDPELRAIVAEREGNTDEAIKSLKEALKIANENPDTRHRHYLFPDLLHYRLSSLYLRQGKLKEAEQEIRKALDYSEDNDLQIQLGSILMLQGKKDAALKVFLKVADSNPTPSQRFTLANYLEQLGRKDLAEKQRKLAEKESGPSGLSIPLTVR
ncbi:MAG: peptidylprolyl isomerase [Armatimonadota bacterium]|nr:peptidylprolyl isomerase [Armatimonadota bacterium]MDW8143283.1 peptidylprolyl isomerase [Armatimonadota bacterium]